MGQPIPAGPPALWVLGSFSLILWLCVLCTARHRKRARRQQTGLRGSAVPVEVSLRRPSRLCSLSKSDTRLHELHGGPRRSTVPRPASMDLHPHWPQAAPSGFPPWQLPRVPPTPATAPSPGPEVTYSNVGLATVPRASLAASPAVWAGTQLTISCSRLGPGAEYACIRKHKGSDQYHQDLHQEKAEVAFLSSRVCKPKTRDPGPADQLDLQGGGVIVTLGSGLEYKAIPLGSRGENQGPLENVYESIGGGALSEQSPHPVYEAQGLLPSASA